MQSSGEDGRNSSRPWGSKVVDDGHEALRQQITGVRTELLTELRRVEEVQEGRHRQNSERLDNLEHILGGNGNPGLVRIVTGFIAESRTREEERKLQQQEVKNALDQHNAAQSWKLNVFMAIVSVLALAVGILTIVVSVHASNKGLLTWPKMHAMDDGKQDAHMDAGGPVILTSTK